jgi:hypothetical protein
MGTPIGAEDENEAIYFIIGDSEKQQLTDLIIAFN